MFKFNYAPKDEATLANESQIFFSSKLWSVQGASAARLAWDPTHKAEGM